MTFLLLETRIFEVIDSVLQSLDVSIWYVPKLDEILVRFSQGQLDTGRQVSGRHVSDQ